jgi:predicted small lipoprotein YifL
MKKLILMIAVASLFSIGACGQSSKNVPANAKTFVSQKFPNATNIKWGKESSKEWEAEFKVNGKNFSATFDNNGAWMESEYEITANEIPNAVNATIQKSFAGYKITLSEISETKDGKVYEFGLAKGKDKLEVAIDAGGKVITKENAKEDEED